MNIQRITQIVMAFAVIALLGYDVWALIAGGTEGTISHWMIVESYNYPLIPFFWGFLTGHFFWRLRDTASTKNLGRSLSDSAKKAIIPAILMGVLTGSAFAEAPVFSLKLRPTLDGSDQVRFARYMEAVREAENAMNTVEFTNKVIDMKFTSTKLSGPEVLWKMDEAEELLIPGKNKIGEWKVGFYYKKATRVIGWTNGKILTVWVNTAKFDHMEIWEISANVAHEWLHKLGFDHSSASDHKSVPYAIGYLVRDLVKKNMTKKPDPVPDLPQVEPVPTPDPVKERPKTRRSFWSWLKSLL